MKEKLLELGNYAARVLLQANVQCSVEVVGNEVKLSDQNKFSATLKVHEPGNGFSHRTFVCKCEFRSKSSDIYEDYPSKMVKRMAVWLHRQRLGVAIQADAKAINALFKPL